ncbi:MAG: hypothetical protein LAO06_11490 [Acidobacteriia bacterium]|nr:hypothetical protein [Terriglobia bacterium]
MKTIVVAALCAVAAAVVKYFPILSYEISYRVNDHTHRGVSVNIIISWLLFAAAIVLALLYLLRRLQTT